MEFTRFDDATLGDVRQVLLDVYAEVYRDELDDPFHGVKTFDERLSMYARAGGFAGVLGTDSGEPVGYAFGYVLAPGARWWRGLLDEHPAELLAETGDRTFALNELMIREPWRGTGEAREIHDALVRSRSQERATLLVDQTHPKVRARYEQWGYRVLGDLRPSLPEAPLYHAMLLDLG